MSEVIGDTTKTDTLSNEKVMTNNESGKCRSSTVLLSGGIDSTCCIQFALEEGCVVSPVFVDYGQVAKKQERRAAEDVCEHYQLNLHVTRVTGLARVAGTIPSRNAILALLALTIADKDPNLILLGLHSGTPYYDCSPTFIQHVQSLVDGYTSGHSQVLAPFLRWTKGDVLEYAKVHRVPIGKTYSCELGSVPPCGECSSCRDRKGVNAP